jgi:hypothetical protein
MSGTNHRPRHLTSGTGAAPTINVRLHNARVRVRHAEDARSRAERAIEAQHPRADELMAMATRELQAARSDLLDAERSDRAERAANRRTR